ncbi:ExbD/TolR family protein [Xanthomonas arboricola]|uniref:ExbD/TolR family protein n=1 Tax=Xanthomonas arboricola TaxID=56448 RepID=UPI001EE73F80|nr:biopolymer transporter ExbD [Xanthomonas arboricola]
MLLIIFIVTVPMLGQPITMDLPRRSERALSRPEPPAPVALWVAASGQVSRTASPVMLQELQHGLIEQMRRATGNQPELRIVASADAEYAVMAKALDGAKKTQVDRISSVQQWVIHQPGKSAASHR